MSLKKSTMKNVMLLFLFLARDWCGCPDQHPETLFKCLSALPTMQKHPAESNQMFNVLLTLLSWWEDVLLGSDCWENSEIEGVKLDTVVSKGENSIKENSQDFCKTEQLYSSSEHEDFPYVFKKIGNTAGRWYSTCGLKSCLNCHVRDLEPNTSSTAFVKYNMLSKTLQKAALLSALQWWWW